MRKYLAIVLLLVSCAVCAYAQVPTDVPSDHWAYEAVNQLAQRGYLLGYPDGLFHGDKSMTRYEFASIVKRILDETNVRIKAVEDAKSNAVTTPVTPTGVACPEVTKGDLDLVKKLVEEFRTELAVIGTRLDNMDAALAEFKTKLETIDAIITDPEGAFETTKADVATLKKVTFGGYLQMLYNSFDNSTKGKKESFQLRRARFKITGKGSDKSTFVTELDAGGDKVEAKDAYLQYAFAGDPAVGYTMTAGQMVVPFGNELLVSSSIRETPEYALIIQRLFPGERDRGIKFASPTRGNIRWQIGGFNGTGANVKDDINTQKDLAGTLKTSFGPVDLGISGYYGKGYTDSAGVVRKFMDKTRIGADMQIYLDGTTIKGEYIRGKGVEGAARDLDETISGYWAQLARNLNASSTLVVKYDCMSDDPKSMTDRGKVSTWNYGLVHYLDDKTRFKVFYQMNKEARNSFNNDGIVAELITVF